MAITYGLTPTGLVIKTLTIIRQDLEAAVRAALGVSLVLGDTSVLGIILGILAERYAELWQLMQAVYASQDPDSATGQALDQICKLTGTLRPGASNSSVVETFTGVPLTTVPGGTVVQTESTSQPFATTVDATTATVASWATSTPYLVNNRVTANGNVYQCTAAGTSASSGSGPSGSSSPITDGGVTWIYLGGGTAAVDVQMLALNSGVVYAAAGDLNTSGIQTPVPGIASAYNVLDATVGAPAYTDAQLRSLREQELAGDGTGTAQAIQADLDKLVGDDVDVLSATVYNNPTDYTDDKGIPPHAIMALVQYAVPPPGSDPTADAAVSQVLYNQVVAGIATAGSSSATFTDSQGTQHTVRWQVASPVATYVYVGLEYDPTLYPSDGDAQVKAALAAVTLGIGKSLYPSRLQGTLFDSVLGVPGVINVYPLLVWGTSSTVDPIGTPVAWAPSHGYSATPGARDVVVTTAGRYYICVQSGTSAASGGPTGTGTSITDGTAKWCFLQNPVTADYAHYVLLDTAWVTVVSEALS